LEIKKFFSIFKKIEEVMRIIKDKVALMIVIGWFVIVTLLAIYLT